MKVGFNINLKLTINTHGKYFSVVYAKVKKTKTKKLNRIATISFKKDDNKKKKKNIYFFFKQKMLYYKNLKLIFKTWLFLATTVSGTKTKVKP